MVESTPVRSDIKAVVFDMDGVLCHYSLPTRLERLAAITGLAPGEIEAAIWGSGFDYDGDRGRYGADSYLEGFAARLGVPLSRAQWLDARAAAMAPDHEVLALARGLAQGPGRRCTIATLTNNNLLLKQAIAQVFPEMAALFGRHAYFSAEFGSAKPDPAVYRGVCERLAVAPEQALFVDDDDWCVEGARSAGLQAHHFSGAAALRQELGRRELL
jgi:putative hydrolase of the HAD superfamily